MQEINTLTHGKTSRFRRFWNAYRYYRWHYGRWAALRFAWKYPDRWIYDGDSPTMGVGEVEDPYWYFKDQVHPSPEIIALVIKIDQEKRKEKK